MRDTKPPRRPGRTTATASAVSQRWCRFPLGWCLLRASDAGLVGVSLPAESGPGEGPMASEPAASAAQDHLDAAEEQLGAFYAGERRKFDLPLDLSGLTAYQRRVLQACAAIPYGEVASYGDLARRAGSPGAARAVGQVMARNPLPVVVPCHRVVGSDGQLTGFGGGLALKQRLLDLERGMGEDTAKCPRREPKKV
jgi:methylated-DNA-[protein]-cysteine S-methyltransferase